ncbi:hypothetical protein BTL48_07495 [Bordetella holmesii]|uniref:hypothetical protein n=1 Tax=Bordetella holmesii TaxID=35814 RepID=UPI0002BB65AB|nr:hypothetical protein [Bordetella holmesii]AHV94375.1 putative exported protein [Bordetella holmesii ATCC 51541]AMD48159.1 membrane protein [Bordetella holmesii F627]AUL22665.1 hypothetical protein BTL48_07495 [Bordetella holmesii]AWP92827.1 hypothetical protein B7O96_07440 [Bordetella holmesii]UEB19229.1 hypothetical protein LK440_09330 [Bordetella holmesii]
MARWISALVLASIAPITHAGVCDAKFMHDGGQLQFSGSGNINLGADLAFSDVSRSNGDNCRARVQGVASFAYAGLPSGKSKLDYLMTVKGGQASFARYEQAGEAPARDGQFDLRILGLFAYDKVTGQGQKFAGSSYRINIGKEAPVGGQPSTTVRIGEKTVGARRSIATALGEQSYWPITYTRNSDPTMATFKGLTLPIPGMNTTVTDWYCPAVNLVMKQEIDMAGSKSQVEITEIK